MSRNKHFEDGAGRFQRKYVVVSEHHTDLADPSKTRVKKKTFDNFDDAKAHTDAHNPDTDGMMVPNISDEAIAKHSRGGLEYEAGGFWNRNRHAVILSNAHLAD